MNKIRVTKGNLAGKEGVILYNSLFGGYHCSIDVGCDFKEIAKIIREDGVETNDSRN